MAPRGHRRQTLGQGLDKEVYQVVRKIIDERSQYGDPDVRLSFTVIYDSIRQSNSSLNRKPKNLLQDSIERVLETLQDADERDEADEFVVTEDHADHTKAAAANGLNRSIVGAWARPETSTPDVGSTAKRTQESASKMEPSSKHRLTNGEPAQKRRKARTTTSPPAIDKSPPTHVKLTSLGGVGPVVKQLKTLLVLPMTRPEIYTSTGLQPPRGILLHGPPGCGKTMIANAFAAELEVNFISISAPSIVSGMSGESEKTLRDHFEEAKRSAPCLIFIDEIDAITPKRESAQREMEKRIVAQLLTCMDDLALEKTNGQAVVVLAATNRPDSLDPALRRGGRFDKEILMAVPNEPVREQILRALTREMKLAPEVDFSLLAKKTPGFVGADLNDLVSTAGAAALNRYLKMVESSAESTSMAVDVLPTEENDIDPEIRSLRHLLEYTTANPAPSDFDEAAFTVTLEDFMAVLPEIQPSAMREGFAVRPSTTFASIGALRDQIETLQRAITQPIQSPETFANLGLPVSAGTLLWGPPGCGKTLLAKAVANASHANFISVKGPELLSKYVGDSERAVRQLFSRARSSVPVIVFFDEVDALVPRRDGALSDASARVTNSLLVELDGVGLSSREGIYVVAATNRPDMIDPAVLRPGRLDTLLYVGLPDADGRVDVLRKLCGNAKGFHFDGRAAAVARSCEGFSGADLQNLLRNAGYEAVRRCTPADADAIPRDVTLQVGDLERARLKTRPSVRPDDMRRYVDLHAQYGDAYMLG